MNSVSCLLFGHRLRNSNLDLTKKDYPEAPPFVSRLPWRTYSYYCTRCSHQETQTR